MKEEIVRLEECLKQLDIDVVKLKRERYGFLTLGWLYAGDARELTPHEVKQLRALAMETS